MPLYEYACDECGFEWDDICSHKDPLPEECSECQTKGKVKKLISLPAQGVVELTGHELKSKLIADGNKLKRAAGKNENVLADLVGPTYEKNLAVQKKLKDTTPKVRRSKKSD